MIGSQSIWRGSVLSSWGRLLAIGRGSVEELRVHTMILNSRYVSSVNGSNTVSED